MLWFGKPDSPVSSGQKLIITQDKFTIEFYNKSELLKIAYKV
jgi:hypothetical protein